MNNKSRFDRTFAASPFVPSAFRHGLELQFKLNLKSIHAISFRSSWTETRSKNNDPTAMLSAALEGTSLRPLF